MGVSRTEEEEERARQKALTAAKKTAEAMLKTLGEMKGLPLKLGQMASYIDGLAPPGYEERFQRVLRRLQAKAPPLSPEAARTVILSEFGDPPEALFASFQNKPFAAASIGQVHRAKTRAGADVAVKVQYPGIDRAIESDLKSLSLLEQMIAPVGRKYQSKEAVEEIRSVFLAEIDYTREAENTEIFREMHKEDASIVIPRVEHGLSTKRVITYEYIGGLDYARFVETASQEEKNRAGETMARFMFRSLYTHGVLYADPHPGNYRFLGGDRVAFLDFGCTRILSPMVVSGMKDILRALSDEDSERFESLCVSVLGYDPADEETWPLYLAYTRLILKPLYEDAPFRFTKAFASEAVRYLVRHGKEIALKKGDPHLPKPPRTPTEMTFVNRLQWGFASVLAGLEAESNWKKLVWPFVAGPTLPPPV